MKILLVHPEIRIKYGTYGYQAGLAAISAALKGAGFADVELLHQTRDPGPEGFRELVAARRPDLVGFYATHNQHRFIRRCLAALPRDVFTILGGPHPTIYPHVLEETSRLDAICVGEGDEALVEVARAIWTRASMEGVAGVHYREKGAIKRQPPRPFIENLDALPYEDREIFAQARTHRAGLLEIGYHNSFRLGRGCPFQCSFCSNHAQSQAQPGRFVRFRSADHVLGEIRAVIGRWGAREVYFQDDTFMSDRQRVADFCERYGREIGLPFEFFGRIELVDDELLAKLRAAGGRRVSYGVESGDEGVRREILRKSFTNEQVERAFALTKKHGIVAEAFVMVGFPGETPDTFRGTADLLRRIQPDLYTLSTYYPNPGTELHERCRRDGLLRYAETPLQAVNQRDVMLDLPGFPPAAVRAARRRFAFQVYGHDSPLKAALFFLYETGVGDRLLRWATPLRRALRRLVLPRLPEAPAQASA